MIGLIFVATAAIAIAYGAAFLPGGAPAWTVWLIATGTPAMLLATIALATTQKDRPRSRITVAALGITALILCGGFALALLLHDGDPAAPRLWLGLPRRAAIIIYGIGLLPALVLPVAYAVSFERNTLTAADWQRVRDAARALHAPDSSA